MFKELHLVNFKNFRDATLTLGPLTVLVGTNASGKSNIRDAFRFLHGIGRGYSHAENLGEKWGPGGEKVWAGVRGGVKEVAYGDGRSFQLEVVFPVQQGSTSNDYSYGIGVVVDEEVGPFTQSDAEYLLPKEYRYNQLEESPKAKLDYAPEGTIERFPSIVEIAKVKGGFRPIGLPEFSSLLGAMRFFEFLPEAMRIPSIPGPIALGDRGENLSSVLQAICQDPDSKAALLEWVRALTPMDVVDFEFPADFSGKVLVFFVEKDGRRISALSASDGTLRFLGLLAAFLGPNAGGFYFFEELENGFHPTRLALLLDFLESQTAKGHVQVVMTTHSPQLLALLSAESREHASVVYRLEGQPDGHIKRIADLPKVREVLETKNWGRLMESGWLENTLAFSEPEAAAGEE